MNRLGLAQNPIVVASKGQVSCDLDGEAAILNLETGVYYGLNTVGARIWDLIQTPKGIQEIVANIVRTYDVELSQCQSDVITLLEDLVKHGLVEVQP